MHKGRTIALIGDTGSGKTTLFGELAKWTKKNRGLNSVLYCTDMGGYESIEPHVRAGFLTVDEYEPSQDIWEWIAARSSGALAGPEIGLVGFDSGTSQGEALLKSAAALAAAGTKVGSRDVLRFNVGRQVIGSNTDSHYGVVQTYLLDHIWRSTWMKKRGIDVLWNFGPQVGESADKSAVLGMALAGKALAGKGPKWFQYTFFVETVPAFAGEAPTHRLNLQPKSMGDGQSVGNSRYPMEATTALPQSIEPASLVKAFELIENGHKEADDALALEML